MGLKATSRQSSLRSGSAAATLCRRSSYWLFSTLQFLGEDLGPLGQRIRLARVVVLLGRFGERQEIPDRRGHVLLCAGQLAPAQLVQNLIGFAAARQCLILQALQFGGRDNFLEGFARLWRRSGGSGRGGGSRSGRLAPGRAGASRAGGYRGRRRLRRLRRVLFGGDWGGVHRPG